MNYNNRVNNKKNKINEKIGKKLEEIIRLIPNGKLILFPSYGKLEECFNLWSKTENGKTIFKNTSQPCFKEVKDERSTSNRNLESFKKECLSQKGAILFGVCGGKYAEGFDSKNE